jgi:hypothetical protein
MTIRILDGLKDEKARADLYTPQGICKQEAESISNVKVKVYGGDLTWDVSPA